MFSYVKYLLVILSFDNLGGPRALMIPDMARPRPNRRSHRIVSHIFFEDTPQAKRARVVYSFSFWLFVPRSSDFQAEWTRFSMTLRLLGLIHISALFE